MTVLREGNLELRLPRAASGRKFDEGAHGMSHCMKAVDFIVEFPDRIMFIEVKDPDDPAAAGHPNSADFLQDLQSGKIDNALALKFRDSFLYEWAADRLEKPVHYLVLLAAKSLDAAMLLSRTDSLKEQLPYDGPSGGIWKRRLAERCAVLNIEAWNRHLPDIPVIRLGT